MDTSDSTNTTASSSVTLAWVAIAILAIFTAYATYTAFKANTAQPVNQNNPVLIDVTAQGKRVRLKDQDKDWRPKFEDILKAIDPRWGNGTEVSIRYYDNDTQTCKQDISDPGDGFKTIDDPGTEAPDSMHLTQKLSFSSLSDLNQVLDSIAPDQNPPAGAPTCPPKH